MRRVNSLAATTACVVVLLGCESSPTGSAGVDSGAGHATIEVTDDNFAEVVLRSDKPVLIDFWAEWCGPCKKIAPEVERLASQYQGRLVVGKLDVDANPTISNRYRVQSIPTMILFQGGEPVGQIVGPSGKGLAKWVSQKLR